jgi:hypothetical protein
MQRRDALQAAVFSDRGLTPDTLSMLRSYPWPLFLWWDRDLRGGRLSPTLLGGTLTREVFASRSVRILGLISAPAARGSARRHSGMP